MPSSTKRTQLILRWPWIKDAELRDEVRLAVKSITGRKFLPEGLEYTHSTWSQSLQFVGEMYPPLAEALSNEPSIKNYITSSIERVSMSQASELTEVDQGKIKSQLDNIFPEIGTISFPVCRGIICRDGRGQMSYRR